MIPEKLEEMVKRSLEKQEAPFFVALTGGTTVLGNFLIVKFQNFIKNIIL
jgi:hypothetical protein